MERYLLVAAGGMIGAVARYGAVGYRMQRAANFLTGRWR